jgi:DNA-binding NtrC family response regulator
MQYFQQMIRRSSEPVPIAEPVLAGNSVVAHTLQQLVLLAAESDDSVLITGNKGTGKRQIAAAIHAASARSKGSFAAPDCAQITSDYFCVPWVGTLFLQEIDQLSRAAQCALLEWMDGPSGKDVRVIAVVNDLGAMGNVIPPLQRQVSKLQIPCAALAQRTEDIPLILQRLWAEDLDHVPPIMNREAWARLTKHDWPGNYTELKAFAAKASRIYGGRGVSGEQIGRLLNEDCARRFDQQNFNLKQHLLHEEKLYLIEALLRSNGVVQAAAANAGMKRTTFLAKMKRHGLARI